MDIAAVRQANLVKLISAPPYSGNQAAFARAAKIKAPQINRWISPTAKDRRSITEESARNIEKELNLARGALDIPAGEGKSATATLSLSVNLSETGLSAGAVRLIRLIRQHDKAGTLSPALIQAIEQMMLAATPPKEALPPADAPPATEPGNEIGYTPNMSQYDPTKKRVAKKPKSQTA